EVRAGALQVSPAEIGGGPEPGVAGSGAVEEPGEGRGRVDGAGRVGGRLRRLPPGGAGGAADGRQDERDSPAGGGDRGQVVADARDGRVVVRPGLVQELQGVLGGDGLAAFAAQVGFERVPVAAVGVLVGAQCREDGAGGAAAEVQGEAVPVDEAAVEPQELGGPFEGGVIQGLHGTDGIAAGPSGSCRKRTRLLRRTGPAENAAGPVLNAAGPATPAVGGRTPGVPRGLRRPACAGSPAARPGSRPRGRTVNLGGTVADRLRDHKGRPPGGSAGQEAQSLQGADSSSFSNGWVRLYQLPESSRKTASMP